MALKVCIYEDEKYGQFYPITQLRPVYSMRAGIVPLFRRVSRLLDNPEVCLAARDDLTAMLSGEFREYPVNIIKRAENQPLLFLNGRFRHPGNLPELIDECRISTVFRNNGETVAVLFLPDTLTGLAPVVTPDVYVTAFEKQREDIPDQKTTASLYNYAWEILEDIETEIADDFSCLRESFPEPEGLRVHDGAHVVNPEDVYFGHGVEVLPSAVIDASKGPVYIGDYTGVDAHAAVYGPCYVGPNCKVLAGKISASSVGHTCRVGGEIEESVFQSYVNKYHAGFIGHSYVDCWVNFGAMTTNSDLKNNYSNIRVNVNGQAIDTGSIKVGSFIGAHTKFGIGTLLNTGINVGVCCNLFGGGLISDKEVPSFQWGNSTGYRAYELDKALETARRTMQRRGVELSETEEKVLRAICEGTASDKGVLSF